LYATMTAAPSLHSTSPGGAMYQTMPSAQLGYSAQVPVPAVPAVTNSPSATYHTYTMTRNDIGGVGIEFWRPYEGVPYTVRSLDASVRGSAMAAGVRPGDQIFGIDGIDILAHGADTVTGMMRGAPGSEVNMTVRPIGPREAAPQPAVLPPSTSSPMLRSMGGDETADSYGSVYPAAPPLSGMYAVPMADWTRVTLMRNSTSFNGLPGVGILFAKPTEVDGPYTIVQVLPNGSAAASRQIVPGDLLHAVDGTSVYPLSVGQVTQLICGNPATPVSLWISSSRPRERKVQTFSEYLDSLNPRYQSIPSPQTNGGSVQVPLQPSLYNTYQQVPLQPSLYNTYQGNTYQGRVTSAPSAPFQQRVMPINARSPGATLF